MNGKSEPGSQKFDLRCPLPLADYPQVLLAHGGGGKLMHDLIGKVFGPAFENSGLEIQHDGALLDHEGLRLAFTTDSYVIQPLFFPGGDIGSLAVYGTVNDLAMCGAKPLYLSAGFILEEGLPMDALWRIVQSMKLAAEKTGVRFVTGDTKVVNKGKGDGLFINTAGIGSVCRLSAAIHPKSVMPGDRIILSGDIGRHGVAVMAAREGLSFQTSIESDLAPLHELVLGMIEQGIEIHCLRDLTRGGLATALNEIAGQAKGTVYVRESEVPVCEEVRGVCEILGLDPLYVPNEGRMVVFVPAKDANRALAFLRSQDLGKDARLIGKVEDATSEKVILINRIGTKRILDMLSGEQLPRIC